MNNIKPIPTIETLSNSYQLCPEESVRQLEQDAELLFYIIWRRIQEAVETDPVYGKETMGMEIADLERISGKTYKQLKKSYE